MSQFNMALDAALNSLNNEDAAVRKTKLTEAYAEFQLIQKSMSKIDRDTFNLDFDYKLFLRQLDDFTNLDEIEDLCHKFNTLLLKIKQSYTKQSMPEEGADVEMDMASSSTPYMNSISENQSMVQEEMNAKMNSADVSVVSNKSQTSYTSFEMPMIQNISSGYNLQGDSANHVNKIIAAQQDVNARLKEANDRVQVSHLEAEKAEVVAADDAVKISEQTKAVREFESMYDSTIQSERQKRSIIADLTRKLGQCSVNNGQMEYVRAELIATEERSKNALLELQTASNAAEKLVEFLAAPDTKYTCILLENFEQIRQVQVTLNQTVLLTQVALGQLQQFYHKVGLSLEDAEPEKINIQLKIKDAEQKIAEAEQDTLQARNKLSMKQKILTSAQITAQESAKAANVFRQKAQEAIMMQQRVAAERAQISDNVRFVMQQAAEAERSRIFADLLAKGEAILAEVV